MIESGILYTTIFKIIDADFSLNLKNSRNQQTYPLLGLSFLVIVFVSLAQSMFVSNGTGLVSISLSTFLVFWISFLLIIFLMPVYGTNSVERILPKGVYVAISIFLVANILFCINMFWDYSDLSYVGENMNTWYASFLYVFPYVIYCYFRTLISLYVRQNCLRMKFPETNKFILLETNGKMLGLQSLASMLYMTILGLITFKYLILDLKNAENSLIIILVTRATNLLQ